MSRSNLKVTNAKNWQAYVNAEGLGSVLANKEGNRRAMVYADREYAANTKSNNDAYAAAVAQGYKGPKHTVAKYTPTKLDVDYKNAIGLAGTTHLGNGVQVKGAYDQGNKFIGASSPSGNFAADVFVPKENSKYAELKTRYKDVAGTADTDGAYSLAYSNPERSGFSGIVRKGANGATSANAQYKMVW